MRRLMLITAALMLTILCGQAQSAPGTIGWSKTLPDNTVLSKPIVGVVVTKVNHPSLGQVSYIQDTNGISGILVDSIGVTGQVVQVTGTIKSTLSGERYIFGSILSPTGLGQLVSPVGMTNKSATSTIGLNAEGLTATVWGKVTSLGWEGDNLYIDDGSSLHDGTFNLTEELTEIENKGLRVKRSNSSAYQIGDQLKVIGPIGMDLDDYNGIPHKIIREPLGLPALIAPTVYTIGGNAQIYVTWGGDPSAGAYRVYRSASETGTYLAIGQSTGTFLTYLDKPLLNEVTRWYKVSSVSGTTEGPLSLPVSATTTALAPNVSIDTLSINSSGVLDITFSSSPGTNGTATPMVSFEIDGEPLWDEPPTEANGTWCFDTTELGPGLHTVGLKVFSANITTGDRYIGCGERSFTTNSGISGLFVSEIADGDTPFNAVFGTECNWTITVRQGTTVLGQSSGTGKELNWTWNTAGASEGSTEVEVIYSPTSPSGMKSVSANEAPKSKFATFWICRANLLAKLGNYEWAAWYANDRMIPSSGPWYFADQFFNSKFFSHGLADSSYSMQLQSQTQFESVILNDFDMTNEPLKISHVVWSGHGNLGVQQFNMRQNVMQANSWMANFVGGDRDWWYGLSPFRTYTDNSHKWQLTALGPRLGNRASWKRLGNGRGRIEITQMNRRLKFAAIFGCWSAKGTMALALGIPKKQIKGCKCVYIGLDHKLFFDQPASWFSQYLFQALGQGATTGAAVNFAARVFNGQEGEKANSNPRLFGDPDMKIGRLAN